MKDSFYISKITRLGLSLLLSALLALAAYAEKTEKKPEEAQRLLVLTDIEADPDDAQTLVRLLLYANKIDIEGLIATTSVHQKNMVAPESIHQVIQAYGKVRSKLEKHERGFPPASKLTSLVKEGLPVYGMEGVGWVSVWGGPNTLAQALFTLKNTKTSEELKRLVAKLRVYTISDQDDSAAWMRKTFPDLFYIVSPGGYGAATWLGINAVVDGIDNTTVSNDWLAENIQQNHGPLGVEYPDVAYGMEGDTPAWLNLIPVGLSVPEKPNWGGWGGRYEFYTPELKNMDPKGFTGGVPIEKETRAIWTNAIDNYQPEIPSKYGRSISLHEKSFKGFQVSLWRWRDAIQNDFAARMDWTVNKYQDANHPPVPRLRHEEVLWVKSESHFHLDARGSSDPDGDSLQYWWFNYAETGSMKGQKVKVASAENMARVHIKAPKVNKQEELHFILKLTDRGSPPLTRYKRVRVFVTPN